MRKQKKTSVYRVVEDAVLSGEGFPLKHALMLGAFLLMAHARAWLGFAPRPVILGGSRLLNQSTLALSRRESDNNFLSLMPGGGFWIQEHGMKKPYLPILILVIAALACGSSTSTPGAPRATSAPGSTAVPAAHCIPGPGLGESAEIRSRLSRYPRLTLRATIMSWFRAATDPTPKILTCQWIR